MVSRRSSADVYYLSRGHVNAAVFNITAIDHLLTPLRWISPDTGRSTERQEKCPAVGLNTYGTPTSGEARDAPRPVARF